MGNGHYQQTQAQTNKLEGLDVLRLDKIAENYSGQSTYVEQEPTGGRVQTSMGSYAATQRRQFRTAHA